MPSTSLRSNETLPESAPSNIVFYLFEGPPIQKTRPGFKRIGQLIAELEATPDGSQQLTEARQTIAREYYSSSDSPITRLRLQRGWSQKRLADAIGTSQSHVARMESGRENFTIHTLAKVADALGADRSELAADLIRQL